MRDETRMILELAMATDSRSPAYRDSEGAAWLVTLAMLSGAMRNVVYILAQHEAMDTVEVAKTLRLTVQNAWQRLRALEKLGVVRRAGTAENPIGVNSILWEVRRR